MTAHSIVYMYGSLWNASRWRYSLVIAVMLSVCGVQGLHAQPPGDESSKEATERSAFMVVTAWRGKKRLDKWSGRAYWSGEDGTYIAVVNKGKIEWVTGEVDGIRLKIKEGTDGKWLDRWCPIRANMIKVVITKHGFGESESGGHGTQKEGQNAPKNKGAPTVIVEATTLREADTAGTDSPGIDGASDAANGDAENDKRSEDSESEQAEGEGSSAKGKEYGDSTGQPGGRSEEQGGVADAYASTLTGEKHGDKEGGKGGEGKSGDAGARGAWGLIGVINIPRGWRAAAEVALIANEVLSPSTAYKTILKKGVRRAGIVRVRRKIRKEAETFARAEVGRMEAQFAEELSTLGKKERQYLLRATEHQKQRQYFQKVEDGARNRQRHLRKKLASEPDNKALRRELQDAEKIEKAAAVKPVEGRMPLNHEYAGGEWPISKIDAEIHPDAVRIIQEKGYAGIPFTRDGFPDFDPWIYKKGGVSADVRITYTGRRGSDFTAARDAMREKLGDPNWTRPTTHTWHHHEDVGRMILIPTELNESVGHTGGVSMYRMLTGKYDAYK